MLSYGVLKEGAVVAKAKNGLDVYRKRRNFTKSPEPTGKKVVSQAKAPVFVIHKHAASHLHYDVRIEVGGVLKSWAVPKGVSADPAQKRLAIPTEDHPYDYARFEGVIPEGNYGAGTVMIWDHGTYRNIKQKDGKLVPMDQCIKNGRIEIWMEGKKLKGGYALVRTQLQGGKQWLMLKMNDEYANRSGKKFPNQDRSAVSGRTMDQIAKEESGDEPRRGRKKIKKAKANKAIADSMK